MCPKFRVAVVFTLAVLLVACSLQISVLRGDRDDSGFVSGPLQRVGKGDRLVFAHYFPPYPISLDNREPTADYYATHYMNPAGLNGQYSDFGGMLRDRPLPRPPRKESDWSELDLMDEVAQAIESGIDGFSVDILVPAASDIWLAEVPARLLRAAHMVDPEFKIMLMPDMHGELQQMTPAQLASEMAALAQNPSTFRLEDGRLVVSPFSAESRSPQWWSSFIHEMKIRHDLDVALVPVFVDARDALIDAFSGITYGMSSWGGRNPAFNPVAGFPMSTIRRARARNQVWMQPVSMQDYRPVQQVYDEAENTTNLRNTWDIAINGDADWVQLVTWNDYGEGTAFAPSVRHGWALLRLNHHYLATYKDGKPPTIADDSVYLTHRTQLAEASSYPEQRALAVLREGSVPSRDNVEALTILTAPAQVRVRVGEQETMCDAGAGVSQCLAPIGPLGKPEVSVQVEVTRAGRPILELTSPHHILARPTVQDLSYTMSQASSHGG